MNFLKEKSIEYKISTQLDVRKGKGGQAWPIFFVSLNFLYFL